VGPTKELIDDIFRERVLRARQESPEAKLLDGPRLFDWCCSIVADGIRNQFPDADEQRVQEILAQRIDLMRRLNERSWIITSEEATSDIPFVRFKS
jgi:hypothetical protein